VILVITIKKRHSGNDMKMEGNNVFFRCIMLFYFRKDKNVTQTRKKIYAVYREDAVSECMCQK